MDNHGSDAPATGSRAADAEARESGRPTKRGGSRRDFVVTLSSALGGLVVGVPFVACPRHDGRAGTGPPAPTGPAGGASGPVPPSSATRLHAFVEITPAGEVLIHAPCPEIGQGVRTSLSRIVAEELRADWSRVRVVQASASAVYGGMTVGGSDSVADYWGPLRTAGATARGLLVEAAARAWRVSRDECVAASGRVQHLASGRSFGFGELAADAAGIALADADATLTEPADFRLIGQPAGSVDTGDIVRGAAVYGLDVRRPGMRFAAVARRPVPDAGLGGYDAAAARRIVGVGDVFEVPRLVVAGRLYGAVRGGVAVVADHTWAAIRGRDALDIRWEIEDGEDTATLSRRMREALEAGRVETVRDEGDAPAAIASSARRVDAEYELPMLAHACMEPINFTADCGADACELWGPTQDPRYLQALVAAALELEADRVQVHPTLAGGGFGRRLAIDYGVEAALISRQVGRPVQVVWTREDDIRGDYYRTPSLHRISAGLDSGGHPTGWWHRLASAPLVAHLTTAERRDPATPLALYDVQGAADMPYAIPAIRVDHAAIETRAQMGSWRSVSHSFNAFVVNSFIDEIAAVLGEDPLELQLRMLGEPRIAAIRLPLPGRRGTPSPDIGRLRTVLERAAEAAGWGASLPEGRGRGIACTYYKDSYAAHVAEVTAGPDGMPRVERIVAVLDCGRVVDPSGARAQMEGAAMDGVATVLHWEATLAGGVVEQSNFHDYPALRIDEAPIVETHLVEDDRAPSGAGEPPYPSVAPAIANAIFAATGTRVRRLPIRPGAPG